VRSFTADVAQGTTQDYYWSNFKPGTYLYHSGTRMDLQTEMGLVGALIVRPANFAQEKTAYGHPDTAFDLEFLFVLTEIDPAVHSMVEYDMTSRIDMRDRHATYWFINGRALPDTLFPDGVPWLPHQPYGSLVVMSPGDRVLTRYVGAGLESHPFHPHGNHMRLIAEQGRMLESAPGNGPDLGRLIYTVKGVPGGTADGIFQWTGREMGWDIYGVGPGFDHGCSNPACPDLNANGYDDGSETDALGQPLPEKQWTACVDAVTYEWCPDHGKPFPVELPNQKDVAFGGFWSGSPYLGALGSLPPGEGGLNPWGGYTYPWHSHTEKELVNNNIFPGGMFTVLAIVPR